MNFWDVHSIFFILFMFGFPRLTMLFTGVCAAWFGPLFFLGWLLVPRLTVAILATTVYWHTNPVLCVLTWMVALSGEVGETVTVSEIGS